MFNYASSYKAVCCSNYSFLIWKKIYPLSTLTIKHMEHSDDYFLIVLYDDEEEFIKFRILHKMMMRLHGFNDSERKTSCQNFMLEFVSMMSFNGIMLYQEFQSVSGLVVIKVFFIFFRDYMFIVLLKLIPCWKE